MRLAITGPQNTGKTTFIKDFLRAFPEYSSPKKTYRDVIKQNKLEINQKTTKYSQKLIRDFLFNQICWNKRQNIIFDRCVLDNLVYSFCQYELGNINLDFIKQTKSMLIESLKYLDALVFIPTGVSVRLVDDKLRDIDLNFIDAVNRLFFSFIIEIAQMNLIKIFVITGDRKMRIDFIRKMM